MEYEKNLANEKPRAGILSPENDGTIAITEEDYEKAKRKPMKFIRNLIEKVNWKEPKETMDFVEPLVKKLKSSLNKTFLGNVFQNMEFYL